MQRYLVMDFETCSEADLTEVGGYEYAHHPSTKILCVGWKTGTKETLKTAPVQVWSPAFPSPYGELVRALCDPSVMLIAANAFFEQVITRFVLAKLIHQSELKSIPIERWICVLSMARALALPGNVEDACDALKLGTRKDMDGAKVLKKLMRPRKPTKDDPSRWHRKASDLRRVMEYCATDVQAEAELFLAMPELSPRERKVWCLDQKINMRGMLIDRELVQATHRMMLEEKGNLDREFVELTQGKLQSANQRDALLVHLRETHGITLPDMRAKTIKDALKAEMVDGVPKRLLEIRQMTSKTSTGKLLAFEQRSRVDGRLRDTLIYHGAGPGRWTAVGLQPQNFPRGTLKYFEVEHAISIIQDEYSTWNISERLEILRLIFGDPMAVFSSILRSMIIAPEGRSLFGADFSAIEARVLFWLAKHDDGIAAFREGRPLYEEMAAAIYGVDHLENVTPEQRDIGKRAVLGCGYQMGADKFQLTCWEQGDVRVSDELAKDAVTAYRTLHKPVTVLWSNLEKAAIFAVRNPGKKVKVNRTVWYMEGRFLFAELPSGRRIAYYGPQVSLVRRRDRKTGKHYGEPLPKLSHYGVNSLTKQWQREWTYGGKLAENVTQGTARDLMTDSMLRTDEAGFDLTLTVHDEIKGEGDCQRTKDEFERLMAETPLWASGLPVRVAGWTGKRYRKG